jgi:hypothetical protein
MSVDSTSALVNDSFIFNINQNNYFFQIALISLDGAAQYLKPTAIKAFVIEDRLQDTFHKGYIVIDNMNDFTERAAPTAGGSTSDPAYYNNVGNTDTSKDIHFLFKGEARDILHVDIMPILDPDNPQDLGNQNVQNAFRMTYDFAIYDSEEIPSVDSPNKKTKKLYFHDLYQQLLTEKNIPFSTANYITKGNIANLDDSEKTIPTGLAIQALLGEAFPQNSEYPLDVYYDVGDTVTAPSTKVPVTTTTINDIDTKNTAWDIGGGSIFFSTPAKFKAIDSINYLLTLHVSNSESNYDQCFLRLERYPRAMSLRSLKQYFDTALTGGLGAGYLYLETLRIGNYDNNKPIDGTSNTFTPEDGVYFSQIGTIKSYSFDNIAGLYSQRELVSNLVHSYTYNDKQFNIDVYRNSVEQAMETYRKSYVDNMFAAGSEGDQFPTFAPGTIRDSNININNVFSTTDNSADIRLAVGRNRFLYASTLMNNMISFRLKGSTHRQAGRFVGIDRDGAMLESKFDDKILGVYFIVEVRHVFEGGQYFNDLHCIKTYNTKHIPNTTDNGTISNII